MVTVGISGGGEVLGIDRAGNSPAVCFRTKLRGLGLTFFWKSAASNHLE